MGEADPPPAELSIAFLSHLASPHAPTGAERSLALLAGGLHRRGHRVAVVSPGPWALDDELAADGVEVQTIPSRSSWITYYEPRPWPSFVLRWARGAWPGRGPARIGEFLERWGARVVHVNCLPHHHGARAAAGAGLPVVWHLREILPRGARRRLLAARLRRRATAIVAVSEAVADWVRDEGLADRLHVIPNGVEPPRATDDGSTGARRALGIPPDGVLVGLFGQLTPHKGAHAFVEAGLGALAGEPSLRFVIAGAGPESFRREVERAIASSGFSERFTLLPPQPSGQRLMRATDVVCLATSTPDPLPRVVLEAMAAGKPVAAYRSGGTAEMVCDGETGLLVDGGDVAGLARAFVSLARDAGQRARMGAAGARRAHGVFSLELHLDRMEQLFRDVTR